MTKPRQFKSLYTADKYIVLLNKGLSTSQPLSTYTDRVYLRKDAALRPFTPPPMGEGFSPEQLSRDRPFIFRLTEVFVIRLVNHNSASYCTTEDVTKQTDECREC